MSAELAHQKADTHLCVALHRKVRIRFTLLWHFMLNYVRNAVIFKCKSYPLSHK